MPAAAPLLEVSDLHVRVEGAEILRGVDLSVGAGEVHALMGPNGAGKSTLATTLLGNPSYEVTRGAIRLDGEDVTHWGTEVRAKAGMFLAFQYPEAISGVSVTQFLRQAMSARQGIDLSVLEVRFALTEWMDRLGMDPAFAERYLNEGFSGGERKRNEILQMALLEPRVAVLDETDSGLDVDALAVVGRGVHTVRDVAPRDGGAGRHPLPATARRPRPRPGPPHDRRADRARAAGASWPRASRPRATTHGGRDMALNLDPIDVEIVRKDFPLLTRTVHDRPIVYLDSAASSLQPRSVITAIERYYETTHANVHRGVYATAEEATWCYENARRLVGRFVGAPEPDHEIVFTKNATEAINLVAWSWGRANLGAGDAIVLTEMEHHANIVPWQMLAAERGVELRFIPIDGAGRLDLSDLDRLLDGAKLVGVAAMSNVLGTINPLDQIAAAAHRAGALVIADGAQSVPHLPVDVKTLGVDFMAFSGHKMLGPTGIGVLWARRRPALLDGALPGRRRDDPRRQPRALLAGRTAGPLRGRHPADRRGGRPGRRRRLPERPRHGARAGA